MYFMTYKIEKWIFLFLDKYSYIYSGLSECTSRAFGHRFLNFFLSILFYSYNYDFRSCYIAKKKHVDRVNVNLGNTIMKKKGGKHRIHIHKKNQKV